MRHKSIFAVMVLCAVFTAFATKAQENRLIKDGNRSYDKKNYKDAEKAYTGALDKYPDSYKANFNMGDALFRQKRYKEATGYFDRAAGLAKEREAIAKSYYNLGNSYLKQDELDESIKAYKNSLKSNPDDVYAKYNLSYALAKRKQKQRQQQIGGNNAPRKQESDNKDNGNNPGKQPQNPGQKPDYKSNPMNDDKTGISEAEAERILSAINNNEQKIRKKIYDNKKAEQ